MEVRSGEAGLAGRILALPPVVEANRRAVSGEVPREGFFPGRLGVRWEQAGEDARGPRWGNVRMRPALPTDWTEVHGG